MRLRKLKHLKVKPGAKSSRFVVDLKEDLQRESQALKKQENLLLESKLEKLAEVDYKKYFNSGKTKTVVWFQQSFSKLDNQLKTWQGKTAASRPRALKRIKPERTAEDFYIEESNALLEQLAFVIIAKLIFKALWRAAILLYQACYWVGWAAVFFLRLAFFSLLAIARPIARAIVFLVEQCRPILMKIFSSSLEKTRSAATAAAASGRNFFKKDQPSEEADYELSEAARPLGYLRPVLIFAGVLLIMILPVKAFTYYKTLDSARGKVLGASESAMNSLLAGGQAAANFDFSLANSSFTQASNNFLVAEEELKEINNWLFTLAAMVPNKDFQLAAAGKELVRAGELSASAGKNLSLAVAALFNYQASTSRAVLVDLSAYGHSAVINLNDLSQTLAKINSEVLPEDLETEFILLKQKTGQISRGLNEFIGLIDKIESFLGQGSLKRYLLVFQNNSELRASGGFIGSYALVDFLDGQIKNIEAPGGGSYDTEAGLLKKIKSPEALRLIKPSWYFWDANWWPDWSLSAKKLAWFYENSDGPTVDGVIGLTPTVMEEILKIIGPIDLRDDYGVVLDADNFWRVTQEFAEQKPDVTNQPKKIIGDLLNKIIAELPGRLDKNNLPLLLKAVEGLLTDKNILFYFTDSELQSEVDALGWTGRIKETTGDYLSVVNTNIAGGKSDRRIRQEISHQAEIQPDGTIIDNLTIKRTHEGVKREPFSGVRNVDWLRIYVPLGSKLIQADGFRPVDPIFFKTADESWQDDPDLVRGEALAVISEPSGTKIYDELGKTVFANWTQVDPGETIEIKLKYLLPFKLTDKEPSLDEGPLDQLIAKANAIIDPEQKALYSYSLLLQKQPGMNSSTIESELKLGNNFQALWQYPVDLTVSAAGWFRQENFDQDKLLGVMVEEK